MPWLSLHVPGLPVFVQPPAGRLDAPRHCWLVVGGGFFGCSCVFMQLCSVGLMMRRREGGREGGGEKNRRFGIDPFTLRAVPLPTCERSTRTTCIPLAWCVLLCGRSGVYELTASGCSHTPHKQHRSCPAFLSREQQQSTKNLGHSTQGSIPVNPTAIALRPTPTAHLHPCIGVGVLVPATARPDRPDHRHCHEGRHLHCHGARRISTAARGKFIHA